jgi:integrase
MPKRVPPLSARKLASTRPADEPTELVDGYVPGLRVRIFPTGAKSWSLNVRDSQGLRRRFDVGAGLSLTEARRKAENLRKAIREGVDPTTERREARLRARAAREGIGTLEALLDGYFSNGPGAQLRRARQTKQLIKTVFAKALSLVLLDLQRPTLQLLADKWPSSQSAAFAVRSLRPCLKWAEKRAMVQADVWDLDPPARPQTRERVLSDDEISAIWPHLKGCHGQVMKWLLWTACRLNEATGMTWSEIEGSKWTIPAARSKSKRDRVIPLPPQAMSLLRSIDEGNPGALVFPSQRGAMLGNWDRFTKALQKISGTSDWHRHDLRRTIATKLGDLRFEPHVISVVLGHTHIAQGATAIYARSRYERQHAEALQAVADELDRIVTGDSKVISFHQSAAGGRP